MFACIGSLSARRAWIEIKSGLHPLMASLTSLSARRAWIEILFCRYSARCVVVALRKESVDRNFNAVQIIVIIVVALRKESVDRNDTMQVVIIVVDTVALRKESVDRNQNAEPAEQAQGRRSPQGERG